MPITITLPDLYAGWPFKPALNPHRESAAVACVEWIQSFPLDAKLKAALNRSKFALLGALAYPRVEPSHLRSACDFIILFFLYDELSDVKNGASVRKVAEMLVDILRDPFTPFPLGQSVLGDMTRCFWSRAVMLTTPVTARRFVTSLSHFVESIYQEAQDRDRGRIRTIEDYLTLRRATIGARPTIDFLLFSLDLPEDVVAHPRIEILVHGAIDMMILSNDIYSYNMEQSRGLDAHNIITVVTVEKGLDLQAAIDYVGAWYIRISAKFLEDMKNIPSFSESIDPLVSEYVFGLGNWVTALLEWSFENERYFGTGGLKVKSSRIVTLLPKVFGK